MKEVPINGALAINKQYTLPDTKGKAGQALIIPISGNTLQWVTPTLASSTITQLVYGSVSWQSDLIFNVSDCLYYILGTMYMAYGDIKTLSPSNSLYPRLDVIYVDNTGSIGILTGIPAEDPAKPIVNPLTQLELTSILINANATTPANIDNTSIYLEGNEWALIDLSEGRIVINDKNTTAPLTGTYCLSVTPSHDPTFLDKGFKYTTSSFEITEGSLIFNFKSSGLATTAFISITLYDGVEIHNFTLSYGNLATYGFDINSTAWQEIVIPLSTFTGTIDKIDTIGFSFYMYLSVSAPIYFDNIRIQRGIVINTPIDITHTEEKDFTFNDIDVESGQLYIINLKARSKYILQELSAKCDIGTITLTIKINNVAITGLTGIIITPILTDFISTALNTVNVGSIVTLEITALTDAPLSLSGNFLNKFV